MIESRRFRLGNLRVRIVLVAFALLVSSCGVSYSVPSATLHVELRKLQDIDTVKRLIHSYLTNKNFRDIGHDEEMIAFLQRSVARSDPSEAEWMQQRIELLRLTQSYRKDSENLQVKVIDFSNLEAKKRHFAQIDKIEDSNNIPILKIVVSNYRPGGFSFEAHRFFDRFGVFLDENYAGTIRTVRPPPPTNQAEYYRTQLINGATFAGWWFLVYATTFLIAGFGVVKLLGHLGFGITVQRIVLIIVGPIVATPLPFPAATILVVFLPSIFAFHAIGTDYFSKVADFAVPSLGVSALLSIVFATWFVRDA